ncbi:hypothetical protein H257_19212, partial [Aphanomyces astaci]
YPTIPGLPKHLERLCRFNCSFPDCPAPMCYVQPSNWNLLTEEQHIDFVSVHRGDIAPGHPEIVMTSAGSNKYDVLAETGVSDGDAVLSMLACLCEKANDDLRTIV